MAKKLGGHQSPIVKKIATLFFWEEERNLLSVPTIALQTPK
jgi:hypothetical protein